MSELQSFMELLTGRFDNKEQKQKFERTGNYDFPYAEHVNTVCNDKITGLPDNYTGIFLIEESYYTTGEKTHASNHLFLFTENEEGILLTSYEVPDQYNKNTFAYKNITTMEYSLLKKSSKFTPALYRKQGEVWEGGSESMFSPVMKFILHEKFSKEYLEVSESIEVNGRTFGYDDPIIYKKIK